MSPPALFHIAAAQIPTYLALIAAEIAQLQEKSAYQSAPDGISVLRIPLPVNELHPACYTGYFQAIQNPARMMEMPEQETKRCEQSQKDDCHLLLVGDRYSSGSTRKHIHGNQHTDEQNGGVERPSDQLRNDDAGSIDGYTGSQPALYQKKYGCERTGLDIKKRSSRNS